MKRPIWTPSPQRIAESRLGQFMCEFGERVGRSFETYDQLWRYSVDHIEEFWAAIWDEAGVIHSAPYERVVTEGGIREAAWFPGARLNFAENLLRYRDERRAIVAEAESGKSVTLTYVELYRQVARCADGLKRLGVGEGDRVAAFIPNIAEAIVAMLATTSLGAIWSSCSPDFGLQGVLDRFGQIGPKVLIAADGYQYNGRKIDSIESVRRMVERIPAVERVVLIPRLDGTKTGWPENGMSWSELLDNEAEEIAFAQLPFDHPVYIMYSSGTTGVPKCMVHGAGGTLLQHWKEHVLHTDLRRSDVLTYFTTCGWMMWNWLVSALQVGVTIYLYDGSPSYPSLQRLWQAVERQGITVFGTSPKFLSACENRGLQPGRSLDVSSLRTILSTGAPLSEQNFRYVYDHVKGDVQLASISGGTDIISCFMLGCPVLPVYPGEIQCRGLGMKVETFDEAGEPVTGEVGELVCTERFPSRPVFFWNDRDNEKYQSAYFDRFPDVWRHGDFVEITETGGVVVYGRSDATLNPGGVRIGTAEIYGPVEALPEVVDSIVIGQRWENDVRIVLFVQLAEGLALTGELEERIRGAIRSQQTPRHVPAKIIAVKGIPHTINGKKVELAVTRVVHGEVVPNRDALADPGLLEEFANLPALRSR